MDVVSVTPEAPETPKRERMGHTSRWLDEGPQTPVSMTKKTAYPTPGESRVKKERIPQMTPLVESSSLTHKYDSLGGDNLDTPRQDHEGSTIADMMTCKRKQDFDLESEPSKAQRLGLPPPSRRRSTTNDLVRPEAGIERYTTPSTVRRLNFGTSSTSRAPATPSNVQTSYPPTTPTPSRITSLPDEEGNYYITSVVLSILQDASMTAEVKQNVQQTLNSYALRVSGIERGRDVTRIALKKKDEKIVELGQKIQQLEEERELDKTIISHFKRT